MPVYRFRAFIVDPKRRTVLRDGSPIAITSKAFDLLLYLVEHPNRVLSKQDILKAVWPEAFVEDANLTVNMSLLRKALGDDDLIVTVARQGYQFAAEVTTAEPTHWRRAVMVGGAGLVLLLIGVTIAWATHRNESDAVVRLAVLPLDNLTGDTSRDYLADGLTEELITHLARLEPKKLGVIARTSSMQYRHKRLDQIGRDLSVRYAVESSLRQYKDTLRISVRLIQVDEQRGVWASDFDYGPQDVFQIEDSVAAAVAHAVRFRVSPAPGRPVDPVAADEVMRGRALYLFTETEGGWAAARRFFLQAIARDSNYALAWAWLGAADRYGAGRGFVSADSAIPAARAAVDRALALDPNLPEALEQRGQFERLIDWNWNAAAESFQRALALDPGNIDAVHYAASIQLTLGHVDAAIALSRRAVALDPVDPNMLAELATDEYYGGRTDSLARVVQRIPHDVLDAVSKVELLEEYLVLGRVGDAEALVPQEPDLEDRLRARALVSYVKGQRSVSDSALSLLTAQFHATMAYQIAQVYGFRGQTDSAFAWLDRAYAQRDQGLGLVLTDPMFTKLHGDARWGAFLMEMRLPHSPP